MKLLPQEYYHLPLDQAKSAAFDIVQIKRHGQWCILIVEPNGHFTLNNANDINIRSGETFPTNCGTYIGVFDLVCQNLWLFDCWWRDQIDLRGTGYKERYSQLFMVSTKLPKFCMVVPCFRPQNIDQIWGIVQTQKDDGLIFRRLQETAFDRVAFTKNL